MGGLMAFNCRHTAVYFLSPSTSDNREASGGLREERVMSNYSRKELLEILDFDWKWSPCGKYWYDEENVRLSLTPQDVWGLWKSAEEINKQLLEAGKECVRAIDIKHILSSCPSKNCEICEAVESMKAAIAAAEGE